MLPNHLIFLNCFKSEREPVFSWVRQHSFVMWDTLNFSSVLERHEKLFCYTIHIKCEYFDLEIVRSRSNKND